LRSGVGDPAHLAEVGIETVHALPGVGRALTDHPLASIELRASDRLAREMELFSSDRWTPDEQTILKTQSPRCAEAFDLHLYGILRPDPAAHSGWRYSIPSSTVAVASSGALKLISADPEAPPLIDHGYCTDPEGVDLAVMVDGLERAREIAGHLERMGLIDGEISPGPSAKTREDLETFAEETLRINYHPACTCRMGPASDPEAVLDADGKVHGLDGLYVCDASIFPTLMRANTNLPAAMVAEHLAARWR
jgi:choline dehydrogenase